MASPNPKHLRLAAGVVLTVLLAHWAGLSWLQSMWRDAPLLRPLATPMYTRMLVPTQPPPAPVVQEAPAPARVKRTLSAAAPRVPDKKAAADSSAQASPAPAAPALPASAASGSSAPESSPSASSPSAASSAPTSESTTTPTPQPSVAAANTTTATTTAGIDSSPANATPTAAATNDPTTSTTAATTGTTSPSVGSTTASSTVSSTTPTTTATTATALPTATSAATTASAPASSPPASKDPWPADTRLNYRLTGYYRGELTGTARVQWQRTGERYQVRIEVDVAYVTILTMTSQGIVTPQGLVPHAYEEQLRSKRRNATLGEQQITLENSKQVARPAGVQDTASQFVELAYQFTSGRAALQAGRNIQFWMARPGAVDLWTYDMIEEVTLHTPRLGPVRAIHLKPRPITNPRGNITAQMWFAPTLQYLPVRIRIDVGEGSYVDLLVDQIEQR